MTTEEIRELALEEIERRITEESEQLQQLRFQHAIAELPNPMVIKEKRRLIAKLSTILTEKNAAA